MIIPVYSPSFSNEFKKRQFKVFYTVGSSNADYITDGTADDVQLQAAIDTAEAAGGGIVHIKGGTYDITAAMTVGSNMTIQGDGFSTILKHTAAAGFNGLIKNSDQVSGNTGIILRDFAVDGNSANVTGTDPRDLIWLKVITKSIVENLYVHDGVDSGIVLDAVGTSNNIIRNNIVDTCTDIGIYISVASDNKIENNIVLNTGSYGIRNVNSGANRNQYLGNYVYNCGQTSNVDGILVINGDLCVVSGNLVYQSGRYGIHSSSAYNAITGNVVITSDQHGIYVNGASRNTISGNTIHQSGQLTSNTYSGIYLNNVADSTITGNRSGDNGVGTRQKYGIEEAGTSDNNLIMGNMLDRNGTAAIVTVGASTIVFNNRGYTTNNINGTVTPLTSDGGALGSGTLMWSDLFLASGAVIDFNNGDVTLTHSLNTLTLGGGDLALGANNLTMTGSIGATGARVTKGWFTDLEVTNAIVGSVTGSAATVTGAAQASITSLGTLTTLSVDNITINGNDISSTAGIDLTITPLAGQQIVLDGTIIIDAGEITGITSLGVTGTRVTAGFFTDLTVTNAIAGSITGNAATVTSFTPASGSLTLSGADALTLTTLAATNVTLPTTGTLATLAGTEELDSKTLDSSVGKGTWTASGIWTLPAITLGGDATLSENVGVVLDPALSADGKYCGIVESGTAGAALAFGDLVYLAAVDSRWELADASAASTAGDVKIGICVLAAAGDGSATTILLWGKIRADTAFPALTISAPAYISETAGDIQVAQPTTTDAVIRRVGFANTADELFFCPSNDYITHT